MSNDESYVFRQHEYRLRSHEIQSEHKSKFAEGFESANCSSLQRAAITKIESKNGAALIRGGAAI